MEMEIMDCRLCAQKNTKLFFQQPHGLNIYWGCDICGLIFMDPKNYLSPEKEKEHYLTHNNDVNDPRYQNFVADVVDYVKQNVSHKESRGLDYGAGTGPVISELLAREGYQIDLYDPFFYPFKIEPDAQYDFVVSCEVVEHFHKPLLEFSKLKNLLKTGAPIVIKTQPYEISVDFSTWYYRRDPTHVVFYRPQTFEWIKENLGFQKIARHGERLFVLGN
jgi:hypothetical protein